MEIRFLRASTGARVAYSVLGAGPPLVLVPPLTSHLEALWEIDGHRRFCTTLATQHTVVMYDRWGCGLSDRTRDDLSQDADVAVLDDVITHLKLRRFAVYGPSTGGQVALTYADRHPKGVSHLVLFGMSVVSLAGGPTWMALRDGVPVEQHQLGSRGARRELARRLRGRQPVAAAARDQGISIIEARVR